MVRDSETVEGMDVVWVPATHQQMDALYRLFGQPSMDRMNQILSNGDLLMQLGDNAHLLSKVDRAAFAKTLASLAPTPQWTPVSEYLSLIAARSQQRGWGLTTELLNQAGKSLLGQDHAGYSHPTSVSLTLGKGIAYDWAESVAWRDDNLNAMGVPHVNYVRLPVSYYPGSQPEWGDAPHLDAAPLDLQTFWEPIYGVMPREARKHRKKWPGTEVSWLLSLNPQVDVAMDGRTMPFMWAAGLRVSTVRAPYFRRGRIDAYVYDEDDSCQLSTCAVVAFRES